MKLFKSLLAISLLGLTVTSCGKHEKKEVQTDVKKEIEVKEVEVKEPNQPPVKIIEVQDVKGQGTPASLEIKKDEKATAPVTK